MCASAFRAVGEAREGEVRSLARYPGPVLMTYGYDPWVRMKAKYMWKCSQKAKAVLRLFTEVTSSA